MHANPLHLKLGKTTNFNKSNSPTSRNPAAQACNKRASKEIKLSKSKPTQKQCNSEVATEDQDRPKMSAARINPDTAKF